MFGFSNYDYAEVRKEQIELVRIQAKEEKTVMIGLEEGASARVLKNGAWGFASTNNPKTDIKDLLKKALQLAHLGGGTVRIGKCEGIVEKKEEKIDWIDVESALNEIENAKKEMAVPSVFSSSIIFSAKKTKKIFYNSEGSEIEIDTAHFYLGCTASAREGEKTISLTETAAKRQSYRGIDFLDKAKKAAEKAVAQLKARMAPKGKFPVVLDPGMTGTFIHEAVGHAAEADAIISKESTFCGKLGQEIGNELVTIYDDPTLPYFGGYEYDDEGTKPKKAMLIEKGVLVGFMNSRETAEELKHEKNGHARAESYDAIPIVRMSNTIMKSGNASLDDVFDIREGIYVKGSSGGSVDVFSGGFMFKAKEGYMIRNGEIAEPLRDIVLIGNINNVLRDIEVVGKDFATHPGICGKSGQAAPVEDGGPHVRVRSIAIG
ncbi:MAG: TldD/PmbA family protein [Candidatus Bilamarchaeaceae archaeon]